VDAGSTSGCEHAPVAVGALALGALAVGALAIGALAVGRLEIRQARLRKVEIDDLTVGHLRVIDASDGSPRKGQVRGKRYPVTYEGTKTAWRRYAKARYSRSVTTR
jgi:hypothetical protein